MANNQNDFYTARKATQANFLSDDGVSYASAPLRTYGDTFQYTDKGATAPDSTVSRVSATGETTLTVKNVEASVTYEGDAFQGLTPGSFRVTGTSSYSYTLASTSSTDSTITATKYGTTVGVAVPFVTAYDGGVDTVAARTTRYDSFSSVYNTAGLSWTNTVSQTVNYPHYRKLSYASSTASTSVYSVFQNAH
jgi:hypothetical protein